MLASLFKCLAFFTPIVFTYLGFEFIKTYFLYILGSTIIWVFTLKKINSGEKIIWPNKFINWFFLAYIVSTIFSSHVYTSIWGYYSRFNGGLVSVIILYGLFVVLLNEFSNYDIRALAEISALSILPIGLYAIAQHFGLDSSLWKTDATTRVSSTFGQPNWLAAFTAMVIPTILGKTLNIDEKYSERVALLWAILFLIAFTTLWFTYSISGLLAFVAGLLAFIWVNGERVRENAEVMLILIIFCGVIGYFNLGIFNAKVKSVFIDIQKIYRQSVMVKAQEQDNIAVTPNIDKNDGTNEQLSDPGYIRTGLWLGTLNLFLSSNKIMLVGTGPETFAYEFQQFRPKELNFSSEWDFVMNKPHNYYLELLSTLGIFGALPYLFIVLLSLGKASKHFTPGLLAFYVSNIFGWPTVATAFLFWLFLVGIEKEGY
ncbi:O-antigen ligase family protein [candidate division WWE3 bacterium]|nr:O-antigen ligase family protein [candidate division WWE3 bacterium]